MNVFVLKFIIFTSKVQLVLGSKVINNNDIQEVYTN